MYSTSNNIPHFKLIIQTILHLFSPSVASDPENAGRLQGELQRIQTTPEAWGLIAGLATHEVSFPILCKGDRADDRIQM